MTATVPFASEAALCKAFLASLPEAWVAYAETAGFDIVLVRRSDGFQVAVEAKLKLNAKVVAQALEQRPWSSQVAEHGPDCRAVLVPEHATVDGMAAVCAALSLTVITVARAGSGYDGDPLRFSPELPTEEERWRGQAEFRNRHWTELCPERRISLPQFVPDVVAGASGPVQLTQWKIKALRLAVLLERQGYVTRAHFRMLELDHRRWIENRWLVARTDPKTLVTALVRPSTEPLPFVRQHPGVYAEMMATVDTWWTPAMVTGLAV